MSKEEIAKLKAVADEYRYLYRSGQCDRETAKKYIMPYLEATNEKMKEIAKKYNKRAYKIDFISYVR